MTWYALDTWIVIIGVLCAVACALPGCFLVLRRMSMMGDAISHAVLPGLAIAFLVSGSRTSLGMFLGAAVVGVLTAVFTQWVSSFGKVDRGASMGIVFTTLFAVGLLLIVQAADHVDLDPGCVLYGAIELTPLDTLFSLNVSGASVDVPRAVVVLSVVLLLNVLVILVFFKEFRISSFDPALATTVGVNASVMHYLLMTMVAITTVASFEAVGSIIVIAMLIVPAATAYVLTERLSMMLVISAGVATTGAVLGHVSALTVPRWFGYEGTSTSGMMAASVGFLFLLAWMFSPREGMVTRLIPRRGRLDLGPDPPNAPSPGQCIARVSGSIRRG